MRSLVRQGGGLKWRYSRQYGGVGGTPKFKEADTHTQITPLCLLIAHCCFVFLPLPVFIPFQYGLVLEAAPFLLSHCT